MKRSDLVGLFATIIGYLTTAQAVILLIPDEGMKKIVSATVMFLVLAMTIWSQYLSVEVKKGAMVLPLLVAITATAGGILDYLDKLPFNAVTGNWIRFGITLLVYGLNEASKKFFPTQAAKTISVVRSDFLQAKKMDARLIVETRMIPGG